MSQSAMADQKPKIGLVIMIGLPGSGKTSISKSAQTYLGDGINRTYEVHVVSYDELIPLSIQSHSSETSWKDARQVISTKVSNMIGQLKMNSRSNSSNSILLFIDDNMYYRSMRYEYFQLARLHEISFCQIYLNLEFQEALRINAERQISAVPTEVIKRMSTRIQPPNREQNVWELHSLTLSAHSEIDKMFIAIDHLVERSLADPVKLMAETKPSVTQSVIHAADLELRSLVGRLMRAETGDRQSLCERAAWFNGQRQRVLSQLRAGDLQLPDQGLPAFLEQQFDVYSVTSTAHICCSKEESS